MQVKKLSIYLIMCIVLISSTYALVITSPVNNSNVSNDLRLIINFSDYDYLSNHRIVLSNGTILNSSTFKYTSYPNIDDQSGGATGTYYLLSNITIGKNLYSVNNYCHTDYTGVSEVITYFYYSDGTISNATKNITGTSACSLRNNINPNFYKNVTYAVSYVRKVSGTTDITCGPYACSNNEYIVADNIDYFNLSIIPYNLDVGTYYINVTSYNSTANISSNISGIFNITHNALLNISVKSASTGLPINFTSNISGIIQSGRSVSYEVIKGSSYNLTINSSNYNTDNSNITISNFGINYLTRSLSAYNSLNITIRSESNGSILNSSPNTSITLVSNSGLVSSTTINGTKLISGLTTDFYTLTFSKSGYSNRQYYVNVEDGSFQNLNVYLNNGTSVLFNIKTGTGINIQGVTFNVYTFVNGTQVLVESGVSDITGKVQVSLEANKYYYFLATLSGYNNYSFSLNPVLFTSYDVIMTPSTIGNVVIPSAIVSFSPSSFFRFQNVNFNIKFLSQYNSLSNYSYTITYPSSSVSGGGINSHGESLNNFFNLNGATIGSNVIIYYEYYLNNGVYFNNTITKPIVYTNSNRTWVTMGNNINTSTSQDSVTGYYVGERVMIVTLISIILFGVGWSIGGAIVGLVFSMIPILFFVNAGFVPKQLYYITFFFAVVYFISKGSEN